VAYDVPLISGKDSMKNDYRIGDTKISIPPTVLFTAAAVMEDVERVVTMDAKDAGHLVYVLGETRDELGGSEYLALHGQLGTNVPQVRPAEARVLYEALAAAIEAGLVASCHDCSDGGLAVALAETAFAGNLGMRVDLPAGELSPASALFSESASRFVVTVAPGQRDAFEARMQGLPHWLLGETTLAPLFQVTQAGEERVSTSIGTLKAAWQHPLAF
jgi:phosphoribosylformylglycinamidine synthase subunit PurSL